MREAGPLLFLNQHSEEIVFPENLRVLFVFLGVTA